MIDQKLGALVCATIMLSEATLFMILYSLILRDIKILPHNSSNKFIASQMSLIVYKLS